MAHSDKSEIEERGILARRQELFLPRIRQDRQCNHQLTIAIRMQSSPLPEILTTDQSPRSPKPSAFDEAPSAATSKTTVTVSDNSVKNVPNNYGSHATTRTPRTHHSSGRNPADHILTNANRRKYEHAALAPEGGKNRLEQQVRGHGTQRRYARQAGLGNLHHMNRKILGRKAGADSRQDANPGSTAAALDQ